MKRKTDFNCDYKHEGAFRYLFYVSKSRKYRACPHKEKKVFHTRLDAVFECAKNPVLDFYHCKCGKWHLTTKKKYKRKEDKPV